MKPTYDTCLKCGEPIPESRKRCHAKFCTNQCRAKYHGDKYAEKNYVLDRNIASSTVGALGEYLVLSELMGKGHHVFRAASPASSCDLIILAEDLTAVRIEVRTGHRSATGKLLYPRHEKDRGRSDYYAIVLHSKPRSIIYLDHDGEVIDLDACLDGLRTLAAGYRNAGG